MKKINLSPIKQIEFLAAQIPDVVSLAQGIPSFDTPEVVKKAVIKALNRGAVAKYSLSSGLPELRETIEQILARDKMYYDFEKEIIVTAGSIEAITAALIAVISEKRKEVILFSPSYVSYAEAVKVAGGKPVFVNLQEEGWRIDFPSLGKKITARTAAILFCNPNNPTGSIFSQQDLLSIGRLAQKKKFFILSDEVYKDFIYCAPETSEEQGSAFFSLAQIPELRSRVIRIFSLSKAYAMTGWRLGFIHSDETIVKEILKIHDSLVTCAPVISQYAALAALDYGDEEVEKFRKEFERRRDLMIGHLNELSDFFSYQEPRGAYFIFPKISRAYADFIKNDIHQSLKDADSARPNLSIHLSIPEHSISWKFSLNLLEKARVATVPGAAFGPSGEGHIRLSFGRSEKDISEAFKRMKKYLREG